MDYSLIYGGDVTVKDLQVLNKLGFEFVVDAIFGVNIWKIRLQWRMKSPC